MSHLSKTVHLAITRPFDKKPSFTNSNIHQKVNTIRSKTVNTARPKAIVNAVMGNRVNAVKASTCWVWKPNTKVINHISKHNSALITLKKFDYIDAQGRFKSAEIVNEDVQLQDLVDGKKVIITESTVRRDLQLEDAEGVDCLPNVAIFEQLTLIGTMASAIICLATNQKLTFQNEAMNEEMDDSLERAATTATSLDVEKDRGNIFKTQSKAIPNESSSQGTSSGGGPSLKRRVKKLEKRKSLRTHRLKRLYKVRLLARVESSKDEVSVHNDEDMFGVNDLDSDEVIVESLDVVKQAKEVVDDITLAKALMGIKRVKPKANKAKIDADYELAQRLQAEEQEELTDAEKAKKFMQFLEKRRKFFAAKREEEKRNRPPTRSQQRSIMCTYLKNMEGWKLKTLKNKSFDNIQELFDKAMKRVNIFVDYRTELVLESSKKAEAQVMEQESSKRAGTKLEQENAKN
nr:hypothetical protein [Tanacetum cinerariifolium]